MSASPRHGAPDEPSYRLVKLLALRLLSFVFFFAFLSALDQTPALIGEQGLYPFPAFLGRVRDAQTHSSTVQLFKAVPTVFWWLPWTDNALTAVCGAGVVLATLAFFGLINAPLFALMWLLYTSLHGIGQLFYGYGWEIQMTETAFLMIFACPLLDPRRWARTQPSPVVVWLNRWLIFRIMLGAGLIKIRGDQCWTDLTWSVGWSGEWGAGVGCKVWPCRHPARSLAAWTTTTKRNPFPTPPAGIFTRPRTGSRPRACCSITSWSSSCPSSCSAPGPSASLRVYSW